MLNVAVRGNIVFVTGLSEAQILANVKAALVNLRAAIADINDAYDWASGVSASDLNTNMSFPLSDANDLLSAVFDAHALAQIYATGLPPGTYPQPPSAYVYKASAARVIGP